MQQYLPCRLDKTLFDAPTINNFKVNQQTGYVLVVDLDYPESHNNHIDLPVCSENKKIGGSKYPKIIADFDSKTNYPIHYMNLKQCLENGLVLKKCFIIYIISMANSYINTIQYNQEATS